MSYFIEFLVVSALVGTFVTLLVAPFAMVALAIVLIAAVAAVLALLGGIVAAPVYAGRAVYRRWSSRRHERAANAAYARANVGSAS